MTQHTEGGGPSNATGSSLPFRQRGQEAPIPISRRDIEVRIENAVSSGRTISETLADELRHGDFANDEENNLRPILTLAEELRNYQSPVEFTIGVVGDSGVGKSSLINSLLNVQRLAKAVADGTACTSAATEYRKKRTSDPDVYNVEIECMNDGEIDGLLRQCVVDYRQYHLRDLDHPLANSEEEVLQKKAKVAWDTLMAAFGNTPGCTEVRFQDQAISIGYIHREVRAWKDSIQWPVGFNAPGVLIHSAVPEDCVSGIDAFLSGRIWPFVKVVRIYLDAEVLNSGLVLVDLPGNIAETRLYQCDNIFVVTDIGRASANQGVNQLVRQLGSKFNSLRRSQGIAIVCTKSEVSRTQETEILRDVPNTAEFNTQITDRLWNDIADERDDNRPTVHLEARRTNLFIFARNQHVRRLLRTTYETGTQTRRIEIFCVSNNLYGEAQAEGRELEARIRRPGRRTTNATEQNQAIQAKLDGSGIDRLRDFCQDIPSRSQIAETRHFLNTRVLDLLQKVELWCNARDASEDRRQAPVELLRTLQAKLKNDFDASLAISDDELYGAKVEMLRRPFSRGVNNRIWEQKALLFTETLSGWSVPTLDAFWRQDGAYQTPASRGYVDWNAKFIQAMVERFEPIEASFQSRSNEIFEELEILVGGNLSELEVGLRGLEGVEFFMQTFRRRRRNLAYEIDQVTTVFCSQLQLVFHDLLKTHGTSYVRRHMLPMYQSVVEPGTGKRIRIIQKLSTTIRGNREDRKLFGVMRDLFLAAIDNLLDETNGKIRAATDRCCEDIRTDLRLLDVAAPAADQRLFIRTLSSLLERSKTDRDQAQREFDSQFPEPAASI
ncbi:hypothetical protein VE00_10646 [Pseudogymnoascus sp. WSF 3629]|nr:hypothetical protein VE00_10646 [Pseudogymnoascus sp. WSF 3629]